MLDPKSVDAAIKEIEAYEKWIARKTNELNERLATFGATIARRLFDLAIYDGDVDVHVTAKPIDGGWAIVALGQTLLYLEYGAGRFFNPTDASYPGTRPPGVGGIGSQGHGWGNRRGWGFRLNGESVFTRGNPPAAAMYHAEQEILDNLNEIAKDVFSRG